ncbi:MAG: MarR family transcriptional regulator [Christensenellales bacterium]
MIEMLHQLFIQLYINNKLFIDFIENICKKHNINHLQLYIIILSSYEKMNVSTLSDTLNITKSAISQAIVGLSIRRLIVKVQSKEDKRYFISLQLIKQKK